MNQAVMDLQNAIVVTLARDISGEWERIVVNYEMQEKEAYAKPARKLPRDAKNVRYLSRFSGKLFFRRRLRVPIR
jgi:hypothetical protein